MEIPFLIVSSLHICTYFIKKKKKIDCILSFMIRCVCMFVHQTTAGNLRIFNSVELSHRPNQAERRVADENRESLKLVTPSTDLPVPCLYWSLLLVSHFGVPIYQFIPHLCAFICRICLTVTDRTLWCRSSISNKSCEVDTCMCCCSVRQDARLPLPTWRWR